MCKCVTHYDMCVMGKYGYQQVISVLKEFTNC